MRKRPSVLYVALAVAALFLGLLVYWLDRRPEHVYFLSHGFALAPQQHSLFGVVGNSLPTFLHVYAFILLTAAVAGSSKARLIRICAAWFVIATLFEFAQLRAVAPIIAAAVPAWFARVPVLDNTAAYFLNGTFDVLDLVSIALGTVAAYFTIAIAKKAIPAGVPSGQRRGFRHIAVAGVTAFGMLTIIASGGGSSSGGGSGTPDTTPPTVVATDPADTATGVFVDGSISVTFSEPMNAATISTTTFTLEDASHIQVPANVSYVDNTATLTPTPINSLVLSAPYTATVTTGVRDLAGNALSAAHTWSFTTETDAWKTTTVTGAPTGRIKPAAVWTGTQMIVWGGQGSAGFVNTGGVYDPIGDTWSATAVTSSTPAPRFRHTAVWDDLHAKMIVWGGVDAVPNYFNNGAAYDSATTIWSPIATPSKFAGRVDHTAIWTGTKMIVWGGVDRSVPNYFPDGAAYDPATNIWSPIATPSNFAGRSNHTAVWTGTKMIVWGGWDGTNFLNTGAAYDPATNNWSPIATPSNFAGRSNHTAVWTGTKMIVWGGWDGTNFLNTGAAYDPATNIWSPIATPSNFAGRSNHTAVWTGKEMIVWGGNTNAGVTNSGAAYDPATDSWRLISTSGAPLPRLDQTVVWTGPAGIAMVVWGGWDGGSTLFNDGGRYDPLTDSWKATAQTINVPTGRFDHTAVWTGSQMIMWGGNDGIFANSGGRYTP